MKILEPPGFRVRGSGFRKGGWEMHGTPRSGNGSRCGRLADLAVTANRDGEGLKRGEVPQEPLGWRPLSGCLVGQARNATEGVPYREPCGSPALMTVLNSLRAADACTGVLPGVSD